MRRAGGRCPLPDGNQLSRRRFIRSRSNRIQGNFNCFPSSSYAPDAQFSLAKAFMAQEKYPDAAREFSQFIQYFPASNQLPEANFLLGVCYF
ncbi:MAG: outer membrane protein assembly factor BamD [Calditrichia bacterium]